jgi:hypothetical protein
VTRHPDIVAALAARNAAQEVLDETVKRVQLACAHREIVEGPYDPGRWLGAQPDFRVCVECGYAEEGWHCGYWLLAERECRQIRKVSTRDKAHKLVVGPIHSQYITSEVRFGRLPIDALWERDA